MMHSKEHIADANQDHRIHAYFIGAIWGALGAMGPFAEYLCSVVVKVPQPLSTTFKGYSPDGVPMGDVREVWDAQYASTSDEGTVTVWLIVGAIAGIVFVGLLFCLAKFVADPIMYRIDMHFEIDSEKAAWLKRGVVTMIIAIYCLVCGYMMVSAITVEEEYVWLSDGKETYYRVDKDDYERAKNKTERDTIIQQKNTTGETKETTKNPTMERKKTPVERGYPSNDLQYYIDHPNEPMPEEMVQELMAPDSYDPSKD